MSPRKIIDNQTITKRLFGNQGNSLYSSSFVCCIKAEHHPRPYRQTTMNFITFVVVSILSVLGVQAHRADKKCARELEAIVYVPKVCAFEYLKKITQTLVVQEPLLFTPETAKPIFEKFAQTFNVNVSVVDAFGNWYNYPGGDLLTPRPKGSHSIQQAYALGEGFTNIKGGKTYLLSGGYLYARNIWSLEDGEMYTVTVLADKGKVNSLTVAGCC